jgi:thiamine phosphate synthase YjbQ (UPF0047 family)
LVRSARATLPLADRDKDSIFRTLRGINCLFPIEKGKLVRGGRRQRVYFVEYDGPLARTVVIQVIGQ